MSDNWEVIVVGAGHAGVEASLAAARIGTKTLLLTIDLDRIALMSCNPAVGGLGKSHLVREIDALGGEMARATDETGIQFRILNTRKGPAVRSHRVQSDKRAYNLRMKNAVENQPNLFIRQAMIDEILVENNEVRGVKSSIGEIFESKSVILTTGTFLRGLIHIGLSNYPGGRAGDLPSEKLSLSLLELGFEVKRLKTGTCARLDGKTIDFSSLEIQPGDEPPSPFSFSTKSLHLEQVPCYLTHTNQTTHDIIREGLSRSPLYTGVIKGIGPRYCPSIEDKIVRFPDRIRHHVFLEPEGKNTFEIYPNGVSTSLPVDIQRRFLRTIPGLENVEITRPGYAIEYDFVPPTQLFPSLETKLIRNLYHAGQINGTSGYEEAAAQGLMAGINAARRTQNLEPLVFTRDQAYIGVMIDDLVTLGVDEPYRMFTSRAEYRLLLREDNADLRLTEIGANIGLVAEETMRKFIEKKSWIAREISRIEKTRVFPNPSLNEKLISIGSGPIDQPTSVANILLRQGVTPEFVREMFPPPPDAPIDAVEQAEIQILYYGYIKRQEEYVRHLSKLENVRIPQDFDFSSISGLTFELKQKLCNVRPQSIGQASRIPGITPAAIGILDMFITKLKLSRD